MNYYFIGMVTRVISVVSVIKENRSSCHRGMAWHVSDQRRWNKKWSTYLEEKWSLSLAYLVFVVRFLFKKTMRNNYNDTWSISRVQIISSNENWGGIQLALSLSLTSFPLFNNTFHSYILFTQASLYTKIRLRNPILNIIVVKPVG